VGELSESVLPDQPTSKPLIWW